MALTVEDTLAEIEEIHRRKPLYGHALFNDIMEGKLSREQLKEEVRQGGGSSWERQWRFFSA